MASVVSYGTGKPSLRRIDFNLTRNGERCSIRLGRVTARVAQEIKRRIEVIITDKACGRHHDPETGEWLKSLDETTLAKLRKYGLADGVGLSDITLSAFLKRFIDSLTAKPSTILVYTHTCQNLEAYFTPERLLRSITPADADQWRAWLAKEQKLAPATISRRVIAARTMWRAAMRWRLAAENPFQGVKGGRQSNESRKRYIHSNVIARVLEAAPNASWRAIIVLARFGGLRTPSETFLLKWSDIDWARKTVRVTSPKLEHIERLGERIIPLFPELVEPLLALFDEAEEGEEYVIPAAYRLGAGNLRTTFTKIIRRAGEIPWPKLWHNLRASRESELMREYDLPTVCRWIGNSPKVAAEHYATSIDLDGDFKRAIDPATCSLTEAQQKAQQSMSDGDTQGLTEESKNAEFREENGDFVTSSHALENTDKTTQYARQDSNL